MTIDLKEKIKGILRKKSYSEPDVVYLMVEIYKFLELDVKGKEASFGVLIFYRNWSCHSYLSGDAAKIFKETQDLIKTGKYTIEQISNAVKKSFQQYSFLELQKKLNDIIGILGYEEHFNWPSFRESLYEILRDIPLSITEDGKEYFKFTLKKVFARVGYDDLEIQVSVPGIFFTFALNDHTLAENPPLWFEGMRNGE